MKSIAKRRMTAHFTPAAFRPRDAARYIGVSSATFSRLKAAGKLPQPVKLNGCVLYPRVHLDRWVEAGCPSASDFHRRQAELN